MLEIAAANKFRFDTVQMPLNVMDAHFRSFEHQVLPRLVADEIGVLGMKSMGDPLILESNTVTPIECLHYALNLPTSTVITGIDNSKILDQAAASGKHRLWVRAFGRVGDQQTTGLWNRSGFMRNVIEQTEVEVL